MPYVCVPMLRNIIRLVFVLISKSIRWVALANSTWEVLVHVSKTRGLGHPDLAHPRHPKHPVLVHHVPVHWTDRARAGRLCALSFQAGGRAPELGHLEDDDDHHGDHGSDHDHDDRIRSPCGPCCTTSPSRGRSSGRPRRTPRSPSSGSLWPASRKACQCETWKSDVHRRRTN